MGYGKDDAKEQPPVTLTQNLTNVAPGDYKIVVVYGVKQADFTINGIEYNAPNDWVWHDNQTFDSGDEVVTVGQNGEFTVLVNSMDEILVFTYVGMKDKELKLSDKTSGYKVVMDNADTELGSVVVEAGIMQFNKFV